MGEGTTAAGARELVSAPPPRPKKRICVNLRLKLPRSWNQLTDVLHFKEDLHRECYQDRDIVVSDPRAVDVALVPVTFSVDSKAALARFTKVIKKSMARHDVGSAVRVTRR
jgi:hypothetical protein